MKYGLHGKIIASEGNGDKLAQILLEASKVVSALEGCEIYIVSVDAEQADTIWVTEVWDNKESHAASLQIQEVKALIGQAMPLIGEPPKGGMKLKVLGGHGLD